MDEFQGNNKCPIEVEWKPYMIDPGTATKGEDVEAYCRRRWGGSGWTIHTKSEGKKDGGAMFNNWKWWPHTLKAHQLIEYCRTKGISTDKLNEELFKAEYEEGKNISEVNILVEIGMKALLNGDKTDLTRYLVEDQGKERIKQDIMLGRQRYQISGVPHFIVGVEDNGNDGQIKAGQQKEFSGAQKSRFFSSLFQELLDGN
eukprot:CAMPEP_0194148636 /NCGR_PEP_ID=MMETSP0152-20130528/33593_1 /TAXON_ID=1049557 /ORGANISM="Thalassiothrix antarctica, Strain L6-D1" /LENGTH=200 /DNA_ID=CAMNT_0038850289 /DNA_START=235 /DNA_END=837 /DNA_ORIENTATION=-